MRSKIRVVLMAAVAGVLLLGSMLLTRPTRATSEKKQPRFGMIKKQIGLVPKEVATSAYLGAMDSSEQVKLMISFDTRNQEELNKLLADLYDPSSPEFHNWLTAKLFGKRFGRSKQEFQMAADWLASRGLSVDIRYSNRLAIGFSGTPDVIEHAFNIRMGRYWDPATNSAFYSNSQEPALPKEIAAFTAGMVGLNNLVTYHRPVHTFESAGKSGSRGQKVQPDGTYNGHTFLSPSDLAVVYNYQSLQNSGFKGQGQTIGIIIDSDVKDSDMAAFRSQFGLPPANLQRLVLPGLTNPGLTSDGEIEADLDTQSVSGVAPLAQIDLIVMPALTSLSIETAQQDVVNLGTIKVVNESFGGCEQGLFNGTDQALFSQAATQGIAFFAASGDSGSTCGGPSGSQGIACPACYGGVTAVGGTQIQATYNTDGSIAQKISETVWNQPPGILCGHATSGGATGGGIGRFSPIPSYQQSAQGFAGGVPAGNGRVVPDVAALAGPPFTLIFSEGQAGLFGGTSLATPLWAGMMTLINQVQGSTQGSPNPVLYHAGISQYRNGGPAVFQDITSGDNSVQATACNPAVPGFSAGTGFDAVTGWGVPNLAVLVHNFGSGGGGGGCSYLLTPSSQTFSSTGGNGTFNISADSSCAWTALASDSWITIISGTSGSGGGSVSYSVASNPNDGGRTGTISISGQNFTITQNGTSSGPTVELAVDGGSFQGAVGNTAGGSQYGVNRLTPASYPATLRQVKIYFTSLGGVQAGQSVNIVVGANTSGSSTIDGITFQTVSATIQSLNGFSVFDVPNITINSGDFVVGFQLTVGVGIYPFANDKVSQHQQRSYVSVDGQAFFVTDALEPTLGGNFGIRAEVTEGTTGGGGGGGGGTPTVSNVTADLVGDILTVAGIATNTGSLQGQLDIALQDANGQTVFDTGAVSTNFSSATRSNFLYQIPNMGVHPTAVSTSVTVMNGQGTKSSPVSASFAGADAGGPSINRLSFDSSVLLIVGGPFSGSVQLFVNDVQVAPPAKIKIKGSSKLKISGSSKSLNLNSGPNRIRVLDNGLRSNIVVFNQ